MMKTTPKNRNLFTLLELVIVLAILAVVSTLVLDNFGEQELRERQRQTIERGNAVKNLITGMNQPDGISRFLSDMGRYPRVYKDGGKSGRLLARLYDPSIWDAGMLAHVDTIAINNTLLNLPFTSPAEDVIVSMNVGWNGPYLNNQGENFYDGWGNGWQILGYDKDESEIKKRYPVISEADLKTTTVINGIASFGANRHEDENTPEDYLDKDEIFGFAEALNTATLHITLKARDNNGIWLPIKTVETDSIPEYSSGVLYAEDAVVEDGGQYYFSLKSDNSDPVTESGSWSQKNARLVSRSSSDTGIRVMLFAPHKTASNQMSLGYFDFKPVTLKEDGDVYLKPAPADDNDKIKVVENWEDYHNLTVKELIPGRRQIYAYGYFYVPTAGTPLYRVASAVEWVDLRKGSNHITLYLEPKN